MYDLISGDCDRADEHTYIRSRFHNRLSYILLVLFTIYTSHYDSPLLKLISLPVSNDQLSFSFFGLAEFCC